MTVRKTMTPHQRRVLQEAESLMTSGMSILALHVPGEAMSGGREATGKEPREKGWSKAKASTEANLAVLKQLRGRESNLGVRLGAPSRNTVDIDCDCKQASELAARWMPDTTWVFGRKSAPCSHYVYTWENSDAKEYKTRKFLDVRASDGKKATMLEIRSTGGQTVFPGSLHASGEVVEWHNEGKREGRPGPVRDENGWDIEQAAERVAAGAMLARNWPKGSFHDGCLALAGGLCRSGWNIEDTKDFIEGVGKARGMSNIDDRMRVIDDTYRKFEEGEPVVGWPSAADTFGDEVIRQVRDWLHISKGLVAEQGELALEDQVPWGLFPNPKTKLVDGETVITGLKGTVKNIECMLKAYGIEVAYDVIDRNSRFRVRPEDREYFESCNHVPQGEWQRINDSFYTHIISLAALNGVPQTYVPAQIDALAMKNFVNPVMDYLNGLEWDGKNHLKEFEKTIQLDGSTGRKERRWMKRFLKKWLIQCVAAADGAKQSPNVEAKAKFESVLVFLGKQGTGKTNWILNLIPRLKRDELSSYVKVSLHVNPADKDSVHKATTAWIGEIGELDATFRKADISQLKAFLSQEKDEYRLPYGRKTGTSPRLTSFAASVNEHGFLQDTTGNRRFWILHVERMTRYEQMDQVWAQIMHLYLKGEQWWLTPEEDHELHEGQRVYTAVEMDPVYVAMHETFPELGPGVKKDEWLTIGEIAERAGLIYGLEKPDHKMARKIAGFMREYSKPFRSQPIEKRPMNKLHFAVPKRVRKTG